MITFIRKYPRLKRVLISLLNWYQQTLGQPPYLWLSLFSEISWFWSSFWRYRRMLPGVDNKIRIYPILFQRNPIIFDAHYAYQAAWASYRLVDRRPARHIDVSSDLRFVTQLSAYMPVTYIEYRPPRLRLPNLTILHGDINQLPFANRSVTSLSCLHVIEHIGLGRYGEPLDPSAYLKSLTEMERILAPGGFLFLSVPVGSAVTQFNAHRILDPLQLPKIMHGLVLEEFSIVTTSGHFYERVLPADYSSEEFACGLYLFRRPGIA
jgi:hypothetical protein